MVQHDRLFRDLFGEANRANVSFYPIDPRGLPAFDTPIDRPLPPGGGSRPAGQPHRESSDTRARIPTASPW